MLRDAKEEFDFEGMQARMNEFEVAKHKQEEEQVKKEKYNVDDFFDTISTSLEKGDIGEDGMQDPYNNYRINNETFGYVNKRGRGRGGRGARGGRGGRGGYQGNRDRDTYGAGQGGYGGGYNGSYNNQRGGYNNQRGGYNNYNNNRGRGGYNNNNNYNQGYNNNQTGGTTEEDQKYGGGGQRGGRRNEQYERKY